jgi:hypothetical protein
VAGRGAHLVGGDVHDRGRPRARVAQVMAFVTVLAFVACAIGSVACLVLWWLDDSGGNEW